MTGRSPETVLAELEARLNKARAPVVRRLRPGLSPPAAKRAFKALGASPDVALVALYVWRDGAAGSGPEAELLPGARFLSLQDSLKSREFELRLASENANPPDLPAAKIFDPAWFPILEDAGGLLYVVEGLGAGRVLFVDRVSPDNPEELSPSLVAFLDGIARDGLDSKPPPPSDEAAAMVARLESSDSKERWNTVRELTRKRPAAAFEPLVRMLDSSDDQARRDAALVLGELRDRRAIPILIHRIARWTGMDLASAWGGLAAVGKVGALGLLEKASAEGDIDLRVDAIKGLSISRDARAVPTLQAASRDSDPRIREAAEQAIRALGEPR